METYVILRRGGWQTRDELQGDVERSKAACEGMPDDVRWLRSYVVEEPDGSVGTVCVFEASSIEALHLHAGRADLPVDEILKVSEAVVVRSDPVPVEG